MIRVASLVPYPIMPAKMGGQKGIYLFLDYFARHCDVICYTTRNNVPGEQEHFKVNKILGTHKLRYVNPLYFFKLRKEFRKEKITHLLLEQPYYGWLAYLLKKSTGIKLVVHSHNIEAMRFRSTGKWWWRWMGWYEKSVHRMADFNFFVTAEDLQYGVEQFKLQKEKCAVITYGTDRDQSPSKQEKKTAKQQICRKHNISEDAFLLLYNGTLDYLPNKKGLDYILHEINPFLLQNSEFNYKIIICGNRLPGEYNQLVDFHNRHVIYAGFVDNINVYFTGADIFINPVAGGGGIKTKLVEALAAGCSAVSFSNGAIGVPVAVTGNKLKVVADADFKTFAMETIHSTRSAQDDTPPEFFQHFYWDNITRKAAGYLKNL